MTLKTKTAKFVAGFVGFALALSFVVTPVTSSAQTAAELQAMINTLLAQIAALQGQVGGSTPAGHTFTTDLTVGSTGAEVTALQTWLVSKGFLTMPAGVAMGTFGPLTRSAVVAYQTSKGISPASGYFGPMTRASVNAMTPAPTPPGTPGGTTGTPGSLSGGAGSVESYQIVSSLANEEVGEGQEDVEVAGLEIEADGGSDLKLSAVRLVFVKGTANRDLNKYASEVSVMLGGNEVARLNANQFTRSNSYTKTITLSSNAIVRAGDTENLTVALSGISNLDSSDEEETWTVDFRQIRFEDATGASISEDPGVSPVTFSFEDFASSANVELKISRGTDAVNDARTIAVDDNNDTDNVALFSFYIEAKGDSDIWIDELPVTVTTVGADLDHIANTLYLFVGSEQIGSESIASTATTTSRVNFDDLDYTISAGDKVLFVVKGDLNDLDSNFTAGDTLLGAFGEGETDSPEFYAEDEQGNELADADKLGSSTSDAHAFYANGIQVAFVSGDADEYNVDGNTNDYVNLTLVFSVTAFGEDIYIPNVATDISSSTSATGGTPTTAQGIGYHVQFNSAGMASTSVTEVLTSTAQQMTNSYKVLEGETKTFTLKSTIRSTSAVDLSGKSFRSILTGINFASTDTATGDSVFTSDLQNTFRTGYGFIAN